jgi:hypothetical protein
MKTDSSNKILSAKFTFIIFKVMCYPQLQIICPEYDSSQTPYMKGAVQYHRCQGIQHTYKTLRHFNTDALKCEDHVLTTGTLHLMDEDV